MRKYQAAGVSLENSRVGSDVGSVKNRQRFEEILPPKNQLLICVWMSSQIVWADL